MCVVGGRVWGEFGSVTRRMQRVHSSFKRWPDRQALLSSPKCSRGGCCCRWEELCVGLKGLQRLCSTHDCVYKCVFTPGLLPPFFFFLFSNQVCRSWKRHVFLISQHLKTHRAAEQPQIKEAGRESPANLRFCFAKLLLQNKTSSFSYVVGSETHCVCLCHTHKNELNC